MNLVYSFKIFVDFFSLEFFFHFSFNGKWTICRLTQIYACILEPPGDCLKICSMNWKPLCGTDGITYSNKCDFEIGKCKDAGLWIAKEGTCEGKSILNSGPQKDHLKKV
jgi:hypothetical protein